MKSPLVVSPATEVGGGSADFDAFGWYPVPAGDLFVVLSSTKSAQTSQSLMNDFRTSVEAQLTDRCPWRKALSDALRTIMAQADHIALIAVLVIEQKIAVCATGQCSLYLIRDSRTQRINRDAPRTGFFTISRASLFGAGLLLVSRGLSQTEPEQIHAIWSAAKNPRGFGHDVVANGDHERSRTALFVCGNELESELEQPKQVTNRPADTHSRRRTYLLLSLLCVLATSVHYYIFFRPRPVQPAESAAEAQSQVTDNGDVLRDVETTTDYNWTRSDCPLSLTGQAKQIAGTFERELRQGMPDQDIQERDLGRELRVQVEKKFQGQLDTDPFEVKYLNALLDQLKPYLKRTTLEYRIHFVDVPDVNAFAIPGGSIYVYRGLLDQGIGNEAQLACVIAHEIAHVELKHCLAQARLISSVSGLNLAMDGLLNELLQQPFSAAREAEADRYAVKLIVSTGYSPYQMVGALQNMVALEQTSVETPPPRTGGLLDSVLQQVDHVMASHPSYDYRICEVKNAVVATVGLHESRTFYVGKKNFTMRIPLNQKAF